MGEAAEGHDVSDGQGKVVGLFLQDSGDDARRGPWRDGPDVLVVNFDRTRRWGLIALQGPEQCGSTRAIGSDHAKDTSAVQRKTGGMQNKRRFPRRAPAEVFDCEFRVAQCANSSVGSSAIMLEGTRASVDLRSLPGRSTEEHQPSWR